ncbi:PD-(D/E)XK nuclease family protein [Halalkalicoccus salilacus]|uniref:hypothetical protein n=1 Tax=Halalkalicoccus TaxID=332246 RepID=UPI002F9641DA
MSRQLLLTGPDYLSLETQAFEELTDIVSTQPGSILYLTQQTQLDEAIADRWCAFGPSAILNTDTFDGFVSDWYERVLYKGRVTNIDQPLLSRLVELGVEDIDSPANPLHTGGQFPSSGLVDEAKALFTDLEFAGLLSPAAMRRRLEAEGLAEYASDVEELAAAIETARTEILADELRETYRSERIHRVTTSETSLSDVFPAVDAVIVSGFTRFTPLERALLEQISESWPTIALLPRQIDADSTTGIDTGIERACQDYLELGFTREFDADTVAEPIEARRRVARSLYRHSDQSPSTSDIDATAIDLAFAEPETVPDELRYVARHIRSQLADGTQPDEIGVVFTDPSHYTDQLQEIFETYDIPFTLQVETPLPETYLGEVVETICQLAREPRTVDSLLALSTNPLVTVPHEDGPFDHRKLTRVADRMETNRLNSIRDYVDDATANAITAIIQDCTALTEAPIETLPKELEALFEALSVDSALEEKLELSRRVMAREQSARESLDRVLETLALTEPIADLTLGDSIDRLERSIHDVSVQQPSRADDRRITVCSLAESIPRDFEDIYVLGLSSTQFPSDSEPMAFTEPIYNAHSDFEQVDAAAEARYQFGGLLGSEASLHLLVPQRSVSGEPYVEANVLTELRRLVDLSTVTVETTAVPLGNQEDVQRSIGDVLGPTSIDSARPYLEAAVDAGTFDASQQSSIEAGLTCATARSGPNLTPDDEKADEESQSYGDTFAELEAELDD